MSAATPTLDPRIHAMRWCYHYGLAHLWLGRATACGRNPRNLEPAGEPYCTTCLAYAQGWVDALDRDPGKPGHPDPRISRDRLAEQTAGGAS